jgi:hypothetical protein
VLGGIGRRQSAERDRRRLTRAASGRGPARDAPSSRDSGHHNKADDR